MNPEQKKLTVFPRVHKMSSSGELEGYPNGFFRHCLLPTSNNGALYPMSKYSFISTVHPYMIELCGFSIIAFNLKMIVLH